MPGSNFHPVLTLENGRITPKGTLRVEPDESFQKVFLWVVQVHADGTSAVCVGFQDADGVEQDSDEWTARADAIHAGEFVPGQALAMAISVSKVVEGAGRSTVYGALGPSNKDTTRTYFWSESVAIATAAAVAAAVAAADE
jgi:hypothetical protein